MLAYCRTLFTVHQDTHALKWSADQATSNVTTYAAAYGGTVISWALRSVNYYELVTTNFGISMRYLPPAPRLSKV